MDNIEITPKELYETLQNLATGVSQIQTDVLLVKMQLTQTQQLLESHQAVKTRVDIIEKELDEKNEELKALEARIDKLNDQLSERDRSFVSRISDILMGGAATIVITLLVEYFKQ